MIKRELSLNLKSLIIWIIVLFIVNLLVYSLYPSLSVVFESNLDDILKAFPEELLIAFNMDISSLSTSIGWFKTEGIVLMMLVYGIYASLLGSNILLKEENDGTIEYLYSKPISRNKIITSKIIAGIINIAVMNVAVTIITSLGLLYNGDLDLVLVTKLNSIVIIPTVLLFIMSLCISTFLRKTRKAVPLAFGITFLSYFLYSFANISEEVEILRYFSAYSLADVRGFISNGNINIVLMIVGIILIFAITSVSYIRYNKKELI